MRLGRKKSQSLLNRMLYHYKALKGNKIITKQIEGDSEKNVVDYLRNNGYFPIEVKEVNNTEILFLSNFFNKPSFSDIVDFTRQVAIMLNAGLTIVDSLDILKKQSTKPAVRKIIMEIDADIKAGNSFSSSLQKFRGIFSNLYIII